MTIDTNEAAVRTFFDVLGFHLYRHDIGDYMHRWILQLPELLGGHTLRLHHILRGDADRELHDHPWAFTSVLLTGGYTEVTPETWCRSRACSCEARRYWPRWSIVRKGVGDLHRLELDAPVWTLVWTGPYRAKWGFRTHFGWVYWRHQALVGQHVIAPADTYGARVVAIVGGRVAGEVPENPWLVLDIPHPELGGHQVVSADRVELSPVLVMPGRGAA